MSGHSKWANIKNKKSKTDAAKGKIFTKLGRELVIAVKQGGPDPASNNKLRDIIAKCKAANMPNDNISRSMKRAAGDADGANYEEISYEGYGVAGIAVIANVVTDNRNRTAAEMRHLFDKFGNGMGNAGCVAWMFDNKGQIVIERTDSMDEDEIMMMALDAGAEDVVALDDAFEIYTDPIEFSNVRENLEGQGYEFISAEISMIPQNTIDVTNEEDVAKIIRLIEYLEDNEDVQDVFHNANLPIEDDEE